MSLNGQWDVTSLAKESMPPLVAMYGAPFQAIVYAERAGFAVTQQEANIVAFRPDMPSTEFQLRQAGARYWWKRLRG